jgi:hypothetical protein
MKLRSIHIDKKFIPQFAGNHDLSPDEQVIIYFNRIPGTSEKLNYKNFRFDSTSGVQLIYNDQMLVSTFIEKIDNFELDVDGKTTKIKTGAELAAVNNPVLTELFTEIRDYLFPDNEEMPEGE